MAHTETLLRLLRNTDPEVSEQAWELCAALDAPARRTAAAALIADHPQWGQAARCMLPHHPHQRSRLLRIFAIDCASEVLPIWTHAFPGDQFCRLQLARARQNLRTSLNAAPLARAYAQGIDRKRSYREQANRDPDRYQSAMMVFEGVMYTLTQRESALLARLVSAISREAARTDAARRGNDGDAAAHHIATWQRARFFALMQRKSD
ncbi:MAG: hypothetical protein AAFV53_16100 [Myxococcota bacterium]